MAVSLVTFWIECHFQATGNILAFVMVLLPCEYLILPASCSVDHINLRLIGRLLAIEIGSWCSFIISKLDQAFVPVYHWTTNQVGS